MIKKIISAFIAIVLCGILFVGCAKKTESDINPSLDTSTPVALTLIGAWEDFPAAEKLFTMFSEKYPNCRIAYECVQNYNESAVKRMADENGGVDMFITSNIQPGSAFEPYAQELFSKSDTLDLSGTFEGLISNFTYKDGTEDSAEKKIYALPLGAELRGMYVNVTLLKSLGIEIPENSSEFFEACRILLENGYIPVQGNPGNMGQLLMYPYICSLVANAEDYAAAYSLVSARGEGISEYFREPMQFFYNLVSQGYYNYKYVQNTYGFFTELSDEDSIRSFLNIVDVSADSRRAIDPGIVAFMPGVMSLGNQLDRMISDYHVDIEYRFIMSPVGEEGGYAYMSPAQGIAVNKNSTNADWAIEFLDFLMKPENNTVFAGEYHITPNTADAFELITTGFDIPENRISQLGSVTFGYKFYNVFNDVLAKIAKANNPKYMVSEADGTYSMYPFEYFMEALEERFHEN